MLSNEFVRNFLETNQAIKSSKRRGRNGYNEEGCILCLQIQCDDHSELYCQICPYEHFEFNCPRHYTPDIIRHRLTEIDVCTACATTAAYHNKIGGCGYNSILRHNRGDSCRRCSSTDHVFWTCNGKRHPGSQFKISESKNDRCTQKSVKELEQNCKNQEFSNNNDPTKIIEINGMKSNLKEITLTKLQATNTSTESSPLTSKDIDEKINIKAMQETISQKSVEIEKLKESLRNKDKSDIEKCRNDQKAVLDQKSNDYIKNLELKILEKDNLLKSQKDDIEILEKDNLQLTIENSSMSDFLDQYGQDFNHKSNMCSQLSQLSQDQSHQIASLTATLAKKDEILKTNEKEYKQEIEVLINLLGRILPKAKDMDPLSDNATTYKILDSLIEELENDSSSQKAEFEKVKKELSNVKAIVGNREQEISSFKSQITKYESNKVSTEKTCENLRRRVRREEDSNTTLEDDHMRDFYALKSKNRHIEGLEADLETSKSKIEDSEKQASMMEAENKQLKEIAASLQNELFEIYSSQEHYPSGEDEHYISGEDENFVDDSYDLEVEDMLT